MEKRRGLKPTVTSANAVPMRRPVLGDVTNKINVCIIQWTCCHNHSCGFKQMKKSTTMSSTMLHKTTKFLKRPQLNSGVTNKLVPTTPVVNTLGSLELGDKPSPMAIATSLQDDPPLKTIVDENDGKNEEHLVHDIDSEDRGDATACWQYAEDLTMYHLQTEVNLSHAGIECSILIIAYRKNACPVLPI